MANRIQLRRDTALNWSSANPILAQGEMGYETDTNQFKIGDGETTWNSLDYFAAGGGGSGDGAPRLSQVFPQNQIIDKNGNYQEYEDTVANEGWYSHICFTLNCSKSEMIKQKEDLYVVIDRYKKLTQDKSKKQQNLKFRRQNDRRLQTDKVMYCWKVDVHEINDGNPEDLADSPVNYRYFYTHNDYSNDVSALWDDNPQVYIYTSHQGLQDYADSNWATCLNALYQNGDYVSDYTGGYTTYRCPEFDVNTTMRTHITLDYFDRMFCKKYTDGSSVYFFWCRQWGDPDEDVYAYINDGTLIPDDIPKKVTDLSVLDTVTNVEDNYQFVEKRYDLMWLHVNEDVDHYDLMSDIHNDVFDKNPISNRWQTIAFANYWWDYPIVPVRLSECEVMVQERLPEEDGSYVGYEVGTWVNFTELINDYYGRQQWEMIQQPMFRIPYTTFYLWMRFSGWQKEAYYRGTGDEDGDCAKIQHLKNILPPIGDGIVFKGDLYHMEKHKRFGSPRKYRQRGNGKGAVTEHVGFSLATYKDVLHNKQTNAPMFRMTLSARGHGRRSTLL